MQNSSLKKKVGLLTLPLSHNYGGILQLLALQEILQKQGYDTIILNRSIKIPFWKRTIKKIVFSTAFAKINRFKATYLFQKTTPLYTTDALHKAITLEQLHAIVVGSDQVWRARYVPGAYEDYFLPFVSDTSVVKISYAASFGLDTITPPSNTSEISRALKQFRGVSVREDTAATIVQQIFDVSSVVHTLDPTLLLPQTFYDALLKERKTKVSSREFVFGYVLDAQANAPRLVNAVASQLQLKSNLMRGNASGYFQRIFQKKAAVEDWLYHFKHASFVVTDSYHGMLFAIIYEKQFIVLVNKKRGATRFESLARQLQLEDRLFYNDTVPSLASLPSINYDDIANKLRPLKEASISFLKTNLLQNS